jgi:beta-glucosidase-like glycosyl hydrolase
VNNNPQDPTISYRSYGENKRVADKATSFMRGLQEHGVLSCAKHFAVKGLTVVDYQRDLPIVKASIDSTLAYPFQKLFDNNVAGVMPSSSSFPLFYENLKLTKKNTIDAATLSVLFTGSWLRTNMGFKGLTFADLQQVKAATKKSRAGDAELFAFQAGNDILIGVQEIGQAIRKIRKLTRSDQQYQVQLDSSVKRILSAKYDAGLSKKQNLLLDNLVARLNKPETKLFNQRLYQEAVTVIRNEQQVLPIISLENKHLLT